MCIAHRLLHSTSEISDATASMPSPVISLCNIVLHLLVRHTALLRRLSSHSAHSTHFPFSNRFLEVPMTYPAISAVLLVKQFKREKGCRIQRILPKNIHDPLTRFLSSPGSFSPCSPEPCRCRRRGLSAPALSQTSALRRSRFPASRSRMSAPWRGSTPLPW